METVYLIQNNGNYVIFHWFLMMITQLKSINDLPKPINYTFDANLIQFNKETIELLEPEYKYISDTKGYNIIKLVRPEPLPSSPTDLWPKDCYTFLRELILLKNNLQIDKEPTRYIYITRNKSHLLECNKEESAKRRHIVYEEQFYEMLKTLNFEYINLEDYSLKEKIKIFQESKLIITPNGGALTMALFANTKTNVIEIHDLNTSGENQYYNICKNLDINIKRYSNVTSVDKNLNRIRPYLTCPYSFIINDLSHLYEFIINLIEQI